jgi:hypothetical protein
MGGDGSDPNMVPVEKTSSKDLDRLCQSEEGACQVSDPCTELGVTRQTLYRHLSPAGELRPDGEKLLSQ